MFAVIKKKWNLFRNNWNAYRDVRYLCHQFELETDNARRKITSYPSSENGETMPDACIRVHFIPNTNPFENSSTSPSFTMRFCQHFNEQRSVPCTQIGCKFCRKNHSYHTALARYQSMCDVRNSFWKNAMTRKK